MAVPDNLTREEYLACAKVAGKGNQFGEMVECVKKLIAVSLPSGELTSEEIILIFEAYDGVIQPLRVSWKMYDIAEKEDQQSNNSSSENIKKFLKSLKSKIELEIDSICSDICTIYNSFDRSDLSDEMNIFLYTLEGEYTCYSVETRTGDQRQTGIRDARRCYQLAECMGNDLDISNPLKKKLIYSLIYFYCEIFDYELAAWDVVVKATEEGVLSEFDTKGREVHNRIRELFLKWDSACPPYPSKLEKKRD